MKLRWLMLITLFSASLGLIAQSENKSDENEKPKQAENEEDAAVRPTPPPPTDSVFKPTEEVSEDFSVPFPTDI